MVSTRYMEFDERLWTVIQNSEQTQIETERKSNHKVNGEWYVNSMWTQVARWTIYSSYPYIVLRQ